MHARTYVVCSFVCIHDCVHTRTVFSNIITKVCNNGLGAPCANYSYSTCNDTWCPEECTPCEPGYACRGGVRYLCDVGTYSFDGQLCELIDNAT